ncbi:helix-turn-helix domain-containing protein [Paenibacillus hemerocallicola]|uniref:Helix-turn-helix domain-containing protein n=1 Tax=Paenibacillus hemerocallicola TaxID=1172614 RepID=A0A5C4SX29_9BACL|nr:helix-turn-helix domain-containing protein [Paenibacillus hemerocallicola]TNJ60299.1 helix-turn-helix domain-containing protein [Paenibacillus hemerocallicola]
MKETKQPRETAGQLIERIASKLAPLIGRIRPADRGRHEIGWRPPGEVLYRKAMTTIAFHFAVFELHCFSENSAIPFPYYGKYTFPQISSFLTYVEKLKSSREIISLRYTEGLPPVNMAALRLQKISALLVETDDMLETIAHKTGYQNAYYLSRVFSKAMKMSSSQYRNLHRV